MKHTKKRAEKCGICFFVNKKPVFALTETKDKNFDNKLRNEVYLR